ncbi:MAG TPA: RDD family protein [Thermoleophilia bacterium]|nr:RDD family protein [Thermoleophilia bacterium]
MQQAPPQEQVEYASLGMRFAAVVIDTLVLFGLLILVMTVYVFVLVSQGRIDPNDPAAAQELSRQIAASSNAQVDLLLFAALFVYYLVLEAIFSASIGKLVLGMRVVMRDGGARATGLAVVIRNLVRIPEAMLLYVPAGVSYLASPRRQRLGDHAARTVVVRRRPVRAPAGYPAPLPYGPPGAAPGPAPGAPAAAGPQAPQGPLPVQPAAAWPQPPAPEPPAAPSADEALARLKQAALAVRGAHLAYLQFSERELAAGTEDQSGGYSDEYVSAWFTLADAVAALKEAHAGLERAAALTGQTVDQLTALQPDLVHLLAGLTPYFATSDDEEIHAAFLAVARAETNSP